MIQSQGFPGGSDGKASARNAEGPGSIPGSGRSPGDGNGYPLQYSCLENSMIRKIPWKRKWQPFQDSHLENSMDGGTWDRGAYSPWDHKESDMTE